MCIFCPKCGTTYSFCAINQVSFNSGYFCQECGLVSRPVEVILEVAVAKGHPPSEKPPSATSYCPIVGSLSKQE